MFSASLDTRCKRLDGFWNDLDGRAGVDLKEVREVLKLDEANERVSASLEYIPQRDIEYNLEEQFSESHLNMFKDLRYEDSEGQILSNNHNPKGSKNILDFSKDANEYRLKMKNLQNNPRDILSGVTREHVAMDYREYTEKPCEYTPRGQVLQNLLDVSETCSIQAKNQKDLRMKISKSHSKFVPKIHVLEFPPAPEKFGSQIETNLVKSNNVLQFGAVKLMLVFEVIVQVVLHLLSYFFKGERWFARARKRDKLEASTPGGSVDENIEFSDVFPNLTRLVDESDYLNIIVDDIECRRSAA